MTKTKQPKTGIRNNMLQLATGKDSKWLEFIGQQIRELVNDAIAEERERCASIAKKHSIRAALEIRSVAGKSRRKTA